MLLLEQNKEILKAQIFELEKLNSEIGQQLTEKYGSGNINLETGEIVVE